MQSGWRVGSILGIPLFIDSSWFIILLLVTFAYGNNPNWQSSWGGYAWVIGFALAILLFVSVLLHELGHSLVAQSQGIQVNSITLFLFGGIAAIEKESKTPGQAFQVAIAGPLVSFGLYLSLSLLLAIGTLPIMAETVLASAAQINLILTLFNLIPGLPLDGGQVLKALVWKATDNRIQGVRWAARTGQALGWGAVGCGVLAYLAQPSLDLIWIVLIGGFTIRNAAAYSRVADLQETLTNLTAADAVSREFRVVDAKMALRQFADEYVLNTERSPAYFAASDGRYRGLVLIDDLRAAERSQWDSLTLQAIARPLTTIPAVRETTPLAKVINILEGETLSQITVLTPADAVAGVIDRGDVVRAMAQRMNLAISEALIQHIKEEGEYPPGLKLEALAKAIME
ncbi:site-2 protease family protein [Leptolyngbya sp. PCC 6406]|uniref:site-2 protease family protein n=1 Tax=Leptolyngbya sp. PCC 6406 TaxID=1173264 RepID=UPI0002AC6809|nr:site-2 protease family protein [Leptolyngbya sp. PCC 6406]